jgi:hypothetical protein
LESVKNRAAGSLSTFGLHNFGNDLGTPSSVTSYTGISYSTSIGASGDPSLVVAGLGGTLKGSITIIKNTPIENKKAFGYMYNDAAYSGGDAAMMDYHMEKDGEISIRDMYLPITIADFDQYSVSAEGLSGTFRSYWKKGGLFVPSKVNSTNTNTELPSGQLHYGTNVGIGTSFEVGATNNTVKGDIETDYGVINNGNTNDLKFEKPNLDEAVFFRFNGDLSGTLDYSSNYNNNPVSTILNLNTPNINNVPVSINNIAKRTDKTSHIKYFTNQEINDWLVVENAASNTVPKKFYDYEYLNSNIYINRNGTEIANNIGQFIVSNAMGDDYVFGLPVYNKNDANLQFNIPPAKRFNVNSTGIVDYHIYGEIEENTPTVGEVHNYVYPSTYLLTSIRSANFKDLNNNGMVDEQDLGGYTKFDYQQDYGTANKSIANGNWFNWRTPYNGLFLSQGKLWDKTDDMASVSSGQKEVYHLNKIETKTHVAYFITNKSNFSSIHARAIGSQRVRYDARGAYSSDPRNNITSSSYAVGNNELPYLEKIMLFAKKKVGNSAPTLKLIKSVYFKYDYSAWPDALGAVSQYGKLTLKKVWMEDEEIINNRITPYEFEYKYPSAITYPSGYTNIQNFYNSFTTSQEPNYKNEHIINSDRWGNYQKDGQQRRAMLNSYVDQTPDALNFDPAAWELKQIKLPTGAEIHVQYEQDDYAFIQNKLATAMVSIVQMAPSSSTFNGNEADIKNTYVLNFGTDIDPNFDAAKYQTFLKKYVTQNNGYIYFKFLYQLTGLVFSSVSSFNDCNSEFIDGYVKLDPNNILLDGNNIVIKLANGNLPLPPVAYSAVLGNQIGLPRFICYDFYMKETGKQAGLCGNFGKPEASNMGDIDVLSTLQKSLNYIINNSPGKFLPGAGACAYIDPVNSYFRLPILPSATIAGKKGGGLRVKRILMYDKGLETNNSDKALYGTEFIYKLNDGITSSGVASNEPSEGRDENPLIDFIEKKQDKKWANKIIGGIDKDQFEGPYGESFLPSPTVGYSKVISKNIYSGKTDIGYTVNEFFTSKDYPFDSLIIDGNRKSCIENTSLTGNAKYHDKINLPLGVLNISKEILTMTQGYRVLSFNRHGVQKSISMYQGGTNTTKTIFDAVSGTPVYNKIFEYFEPWESVPVANDVLLPPAQYLQEPIGREVEIYSERRYIEDNTNSGGAVIDGALSISVPPILTLSGYPTFTRSVNRFGRISTTKVVYLPTILKRTTEFKDGITNTLENVLFSSIDGNPIVTKTFDPYNKVNVNGQNIIRENYNYNQYANLFNNTFLPKNTSEGMSISINGIIQIAPGNYPYLEFNVGGVTDDLLIGVGDLITLKNTNNYFYYISGINKFLSGSTNKVRYYLFPHPSNLSTITTFTDITMFKNGKNYPISTPVGSLSTFNSANLTGTSVPSSIENARNSFIGILNSASNFTNGNNGIVPFKTGTTTSPTTIIDLLPICSTSHTNTFGCNYVPQITNCINKPCCLNLGTTYADLNSNSTSNKSYIYLADPNHTVDQNGYISAFSPPTMPLQLNSLLTTTLDICCQPATANNCNTCPQATNPIPLYLNSFEIDWNNIPNLNNTNNIFTSILIPSTSYYGVYFYPDLGNTASMVLIPFLSSMDQNVTTNIAQALTANYLNNLPNKTLDQTDAINFGYQLCFNPQYLGVDLDGNKKLSSTEMAVCKACFLYEPPPPTCPCTTVNNLNFYLKTYRDPSNNDLFITMEDQHHTSNINVSPIITNTFLNSKLGVAFTNNKIQNCTNSDCRTCPPSPSPNLPFLVNFQYLGKAGGIFTLNPYDKYTVFYTPPNDDEVPVEAISFCNSAKASRIITNTLANSAVTFKHDWSQQNIPSYYNTAEYIAANDFLKNKKGFWNINKSYAYNTIRTSSNPKSTNKIYQNGTYQLELGEWIKPNVNNNWQVSNSINIFSPNGEPLEELDALNIPSTSSYIGDKTLPTIVAQNASLNSVYFESVEAPGYSPIGGTGLSVSNYNHSGSKCINLNNTYAFFEYTMPYPNSLRNNTVIVKFWASMNPSYKETPVYSATYQNITEIKGEFNGTVFTAKKVASSGIWNLYEATTTLNAPLTTNNLVFQIYNSVKFEGASAFVNSTLYLDDILFQPKLAKCNAYVFDYDKRKILTQFDDQHFGLFYLYNPEGKLVRKLKETERGMKMIEERQYNSANKIPQPIN